MGRIKTKKHGRPERQPASPLERALRAIYGTQFLAKELSGIVQRWAAEDSGVSGFAMVRTMQCAALRFALHGALTELGAVLEQLAGPPAQPATEPAAK